MALPDAERSRLLTEIYDSLTENTLLPSSAILRRCALEMTSCLPRKTARRDLAASIVGSLQKLPVSEIKEKLSVIESTPNKRDRSLTAWSDIILDRSRRMLNPD